MQEPKYYALSFSCSKRLQAASAEEMGLTSVPVVSGEAGSFSNERTEHYASDLRGLAAYLLSDDALCMNLLVERIEDVLKAEHHLQVDTPVCRRR